MNKYFPSRPRHRRAGTVDVRGTVPAAPAYAGIRFVPGEDVLLLNVSLPRMSAAQRRVAVVFAVEDHVARPLEDVHIALGPEMQANQWLVGVIARSALPADTRPGQRLLPDTLTVPVPPPGQWSAREDAGRILIRLPDGTGFVTRAHALPALHQAAGAPVITLYAGQIAVGHTVAALPAVALPAHFDLADSRSQSFALPPLARRLIAIAIVAAFGHLTILTADTLSLSRQQSALADALRIEAGAGAEVETDDLVARILAPSQTETEAGFLPLLGAAFVAMSPSSGQVTLRELRYDAGQDSLTFALLASDIATLQQVEADLVTAGLTVTSGSATSANGTAEQQLALIGPP